MAFQFVIGPTPLIIAFFAVIALVISRVVYPKSPARGTTTRRWQCSILDVFILLWQFGLTGVLVFRPDEERKCNVKAPEF